MHFFQIDIVSSSVSEDKSKMTTPLKATKAVLGLIIDRVYLSEFTWSGKSKPGIRKIALKNYQHIYGLIYSVVSRSHKSYTKESYRKDLIDRI